MPMLAITPSSDRWGKRVDRLRPLAHKKSARFSTIALACWLRRFDRNKSHSFPRCGLADRLRVGCVRFPAFDEWLHVNRRDQSHVMAQSLDLPGPIMPPPQASMATRQGGVFSKKRRTLARRSFRLKSASPLAAEP